MPWELDNMLLSFIQFKKSKYYLSKEDTVEINPCLNLSSYLIDWDKSSITKDHLKDRFNQYLKLLKDYKVSDFVYEGNKLYGHLDHQREAISKEVDFYLSVCPDMYFSEHLLSLLIQSSKEIPNKYFVITPEISKMWDGTWDEITCANYLDVPYDSWNKVDIFDIRAHMKGTNSDITLETISKSKWAGWFDLYNKAMYEELVRIHDDWTGYGPWDWYSLMLTDFLKQKEIDFQQYILRGQTIFEYPVGPLLEGGFTKMYKDLMYINDVPNQRELFESKMKEYLDKGIKMLQEKEII
ncbi:hypothetical protein OAA23_00225 [bacterium]|nr:hypothetical protein [bacterium]